MWRYFFLIVKLIKITNMSKTIEQACQDAICHLQKQRVNDRILERCKESFFDGAEYMQKEYEEKLRWIPVEERLPEKMQTEPSVSKVVQVKSKNFSEPFCAFYNHLYGIWLPYPFGSNPQIVGITEWRSFL